MATISTDVVQSLSVLKRTEGRKSLARALEWEDFDEDEEPRKGIILDFHYDNIMYCVQKGMAWEQISILVDLAATVLEQSTDKCLQEIIKIYHQECQSICTSVSLNNMKTFTQYFFETFMRHYKLYQFVLNREQAPLTIETTVDVDTPEELLAFTEAKEAPLWEYEQKFQAVEAKEEAHQEHRDCLNETREREIQENLEVETEKFQNLETPLEQEKLLEMINSIAKVHITAASHKITTEISNAMDDLNFMLQKTSIPRPQELGPPTRFKTKAPIAMPKRIKSTSKEKVASREKSGKSQSRADSKSKAK